MDVAEVPQTSSLIILFSKKMERHPVTDLEKDISLIIPSWELRTLYDKCSYLCNNIVMDISSNFSCVVFCSILVLCLMTCVDVNYRFCNSPKVTMGHHYFLNEFDRFIILKNMSYCKIIVSCNQ